MLNLKHRPFLCSTDIPQRSSPQIRASHAWISAAVLGFMAITPSAHALQIPIYKLSGQAAGDWFGHSVDGAGDVNNDGTPDFIVGAPMGSYAKVYSGRDGSQLFHLVAPAQTMGFFGTAVSGAGDVNRDGFADLIVGDTDPTGTVHGGYADVFSGRDGTLLYQFVGLNRVNVSFGFSVDGVGDINRDGFDDVIVGDPEHWYYFQGHARVFSGADGSVLRDLFPKPAGTRGAFGYSVAGIGDVNQDGFPDVAVGNYRSGYKRLQQAGSIHVFYGNTWKQKIVDYGKFLERIGQNVSRVGDVDLDGYDDILSSTGYAGRGSSSTSRFSGSVRVHSGESGERILMSRGAALDACHGSDVAGVGDANGDGYPDILVGSVCREYIELLSGRTGAVLLRYQNPGFGHSFGHAVARVGDVNGSGLNDFIVGAPLDGAASGSIWVFAGLPNACSKSTSTADCNQNGIPDDCEIYAGITSDSNSNQIPDDCEALVLSQPSPGLAGRDNDFRVSLALPQARSLLFRGRLSGTTSLSPCPGISLGIRAPRLVGSNTASGKGAVKLTTTVPAKMSMQTLLFQAFEERSCRVSNVVSFTFP